MFKSVPKIVHRNLNAAKTSKHFIKSHNSFVATASLQKQQQQQLMAQKRSRYDYTVSCSFELENEEREKKCLQLLNEKGKLVEEKNFKETYYDKVPGQVKSSDAKKSVQTSSAAETEDYTLGRKDCWLRLVDGKNWILKSPFKEEITNRTHMDEDIKTGRTPRYHISEGEGSIRRELNLQQDATLGDDQKKTLEQELLSRGIVPFFNVEYKTKLYELDPEENITVEIVFTDNGYKYSTVRIVIPNCRQRDMEEKIPVYEKAMDDLGFEDLRKQNSVALEPVKKHISTNMKDYQKVLMDAGIFIDPSVQKY